MRPAYIATSFLGFCYTDISLTVHNISDPICAAQTLSVKTTKTFHLTEGNDAKSAQVKGSIATMGQLLYKL